MRVTTRLTPNRCWAIWLAMMLRLSPWVAATKASARSMPARLSTSWSMPLPRMVVPPKSEPSREKAEPFVSRIVTSWPEASSICARRAPTRPQPMMMTNVPTALLVAALTHGGDCVRHGRSHRWRGARDPDTAGCVLQDVRRRVPQVELAELALVGDAHHDQVGLAFERFVDDRGAEIASLQD